MKHLASIIVGAVFVVVIGIALFVQGAYLFPTKPEVSSGRVSASYVYVFPGLQGPGGNTIVPAAVATPSTEYRGADSGLAVLLTDTNAKWLQLAHGLRAIGIPFIITTDYKQALHHKVIFVYPELSSKVLPPLALKMLTDFPKHGGTLIAQSVNDSFNAVFGFEKSSATTQNTELHINPHTSVTNSFIEPEDQLIKIGITSAKNLSSTSYTNPANTPLATYEANTPAIIQKKYPNAGSAYALGLDVGKLAALCYSSILAWSDEHPTVSQYGANHYQPTLDVLLRLLRQMYVEGQKNAVILATVPYGKSLAVIMSHDINYVADIKNSLEYAEFEQRHDIKATYFVQTKYITDWNDKAFFIPANIPLFQQLQDMGMEIADNTVAASLQFNLLPEGTGKEQYPSYVPYVVNEFHTLNATILGELRVSYFLLQHFFPDQSIVSFRSSGLIFPKLLPQALAATGFHYDSSATANDVLTHLPFQLDYNGVSPAEVPVYEFPITLDDRQDVLANSLDLEVGLAKKLSRYGGLMVALVQPSGRDKKYEFEKNFINALHRELNDSVWYGTLKDFGNWWAARDQVKIAVSTTSNKKVKIVKVSVNAPIAISGLTLTVSPKMRYVSNNRPGVIVTQQGNSVIIKHLAGSVTLLFQ